MGERDRPNANTPADEGASSVERDEIREKSGGSRPVGDRTNHPLSGGGDEETEDGLDEVSESVRHAAEDIPDEPDPYVAEADEEDVDELMVDEEMMDEDRDDESEPEEDEDDLPVFDRGSRR